MSIQQQMKDLVAEFREMGLRVDQLAYGRVLVGSDSGHEGFMVTPADVEDGKLDEVRRKARILAAGGSIA